MRHICEHSPLSTSRSRSARSSSFEWSIDLLVQQAARIIRTMNPIPRPDFSSRLGALPTFPGVYLMKDDTGTILYVGKAAALRNRVRSYFQSKRGMDPKTRELVSHIADFAVIRTDTATEALL